MSLLRLPIKEEVDIAFFRQFKNTSHCRYATHQAAPTKEGPTRMSALAESGSPERTNLGTGSKSSIFSNSWLSIGPT